MPTYTMKPKLILKDRYPLNFIYLKLPAIHPTNACVFLNVAIGDKDWLASYSRAAYD